MGDLRDGSGGLEEILLSNALTPGGLHRRPWELRRQQTSARRSASTPTQLL